jgi:hypothetical protein
LYVGGHCYRVADHVGGQWVTSSVTGTL